VYKHTNACLDVGVLACIHACMYLSMHVCIHVYIYVCMHVRVFMCAHGVCGCVYVRIDIYVRGETDKNISNVM